MCFEVLGFDILIDADLRPWLLEVNFTPSFMTDSRLDFRIKSQLIQDTLKLMVLPDKERQCFGRVHAQYLQRRAAGNKTKQDHAELKAIAQDIRDLHENSSRGGFIKIFPANDYFCYSKYIRYSQVLWTGGLLEAIYVRARKNLSPVRAARTAERKKRGSPTTPRKMNIHRSPCRVNSFIKSLNFGSVDSDKSHSRSNSNFTALTEKLII
jgi:hypothetical protein